MATGLDSERVIVSSPMSVSGGVQRSLRLGHKWPRPANQWAAILVGVCAWSAAICLAVVWGVAALVWTLFWLFVFWPGFVIWRLFRRGNRNRRAEQLRHRETLAAIERQRQA